MKQSSSHGFTSPLRYPGGKGMLANFMKLVISENHLLDGHYAELYAGGAGIAWPLLFEEYVQHVHINDLNRGVFAFWRAVLEEPDKLCRLIWDTPITMEEWFRQKAKQENPDQESCVELGYSTFFLNRTNRSGIIQGGVIGGKKQLGKWKLDARFNRSDLVGRIERIARYARRISLYNLDASDFICNIPNVLPKNTLVYLDPPYYKKGMGLYEDHYFHADHVDVANLIARDKERHWIVSYDSVPQILGLYKEYRNKRYRLSYSAQARYSGSEVMFFSHQLVVPKVSDPTQAK